MRIALIAHDSRKELMAQFCTAYIRILSQNELVATGVTGKVVHDNTGLPVRCLYPGGRGGAEQISSMIACGEVDMLLFFRDPVGAVRMNPTPSTCCACAICTPSRWPPTLPPPKCSSTAWNGATLPGSNCSGTTAERPKADFDAKIRPRTLLQGAGTFFFGLLTLEPFQGL